MRSSQTRYRLFALLVVAVTAACQDRALPTSPAGTPNAAASVAGLPVQAQQRAAWFAQTAPGVLGLPETVYADDDETTGQLVFGVEHPGVVNSVRGVLARRGIPASAYRIEVVEPIHFMATLRDVFRPTVAGIQIHFGQYLCTLGFNADHAGGRSMITASHCTNQQGGTESTQYYQPLSSSSSVVAIEADDPAYGSLPGCSAGKKCRYSDAARALYQSGTASNRGEIAMTTGVNNGSLTTSGVFSVTEQANSTTNFSGTIHKVGRTTGWTSGSVAGTCVTVNVSGSNVQLHCQTLVQRNGTIVGPGDSGGSVFQVISGSNVRLVGVLWGGSSAGDLFVFSPLKNVQDELGGLVATTSGSGGGDPPPPPPPDECIPRGKSGKCK